MSPKKSSIFAIIAVVFLGICAVLFINNPSVFSVNTRRQAAAVADFDSNLIAHYAFDNGTAADVSGNGHNGTINGATLTAGKIGSGALSFDGVDDYVNVGDIDAIDGLPQFTISAWVKSSTVRPGGSPAFVSKWSDQYAGQFILYYTSQTNACALALWASTIGENHTGGATCLEDTNWHHVVAVYTGTSTQVYLDTRPSGDSRNLSGSLRSSDGHNIFIGKSSTPGHEFSGSIDDVRIYNKSLTQSEIRDLFALSGEAPPVITSGVCGASVNSCGAGALLDVADTASNYLWSCLGTGGGANASCSASITQGPIDTTAPVITNTTASSFVASTTQISLTVMTNEVATCKYGTTVDTPYESMANTFAGGGSTSHTATVSGLSSGNSYTYNVRCIDALSNVNTSDMVIAFRVRNVVVNPINAERVGSEARLAFPNSALWNSVVSFRPGNSEVVDLNPPRFTWPYNKNPAGDGCPEGSYANCHGLSPKRFVFQVAASEADLRNQTNLIINKQTPNNGYNFLSSSLLTRGQTYYWWVGYLYQRNLVDHTTWQLDPLSFETVPCSTCWTGVRSFTVAGNATAWDKGRLADEDYLLQKSAHPHLLFDTTTRADLYDYLKNAETFHLNSEIPQQKSTAISWKKLKEKARAYVPPASISTSGDIRVTTIPEVATAGENVSRMGFVWQLTKEASITSSDPLERADAQLHLDIEAKQPWNLLEKMADAYITRSLYQWDTDVASLSLGVRSFGYGFDWYYDKLSKVQKDKILRVIDSYLSHYSATIEPNTPPNRDEVLSSHWVPSYAIGRVGNSHAWANQEVGIVLALSTYASSTVARQYFDTIVDRMLTLPTFAGSTSEGAQNQGGYSWSNLYNGYNMLMDTITAQIMFYPEVKFSTNPFWKTNAEWFGSTMPVGHTQHHEPWGDGSMGRAGEEKLWNTPSLGRNLAYFLSDGKVLQHYEKERAALNGNEICAVGDYGYCEEFDMLVVPYYAQNNLKGLSVPSQQTDTKLTHLFLHDGWAVKCTKPTNTAYSSGNSCFRDGVGLIFKAAPNNGLGMKSHANYAGLSFQLWAYGVPLTDVGGQNLTDYSKLTEGQYSILIDGKGQFQSDEVPTKPFYGRLTGYKDGVNYEYFAGDVTNSYPSVFTNQYGSPLTNLQKVQRHMLLVRDKYYVVFDDLQSGNNSTFTWLYHVPWLYNVQSPQNVHPPQTQKTDTFRFGQTPTEFTYRTSNITPYLSERASNERQATTTVKMINTPSTVEVIDMTGTGLATTTPQQISAGLKRGGNVRTNPLTVPAQNFMKSQMIYGDAYPTSHTLWVSNTQPARNFHFMTVIYPHEPGRIAPVIERYGDDFTARVINADGTVDIISFNPDTAPVDTTILIDLEDLTPLPVVDDVMGTTVVSVPYVPPVQPTQATLTVAKSGLGLGAVTADNNSINCGDGGSTCSYVGNVGSTVTLSVVPGLNSAFAAWGGACSGIASSAPCVVTLSSNKSVTATFMPVNDPSNEDEIPPVFLSNEARAKSTNAVVMVNTDEVVTSVLHYGLTAGYGNVTPQISSVGTTTRFSLSSLQPNTTYHYRVVATDASGNVATSTTRTFVTLSGTTTPVDNIPPTVTITSPSTPVVMLIGKRSFTLSADANDASGIESVKFYVNNQLYATTTQFPFSVAYNNQLGDRTVFAVARDLVGNQATSTTISFRLERATTTATTTIPVTPPVGIDAGGTSVVTRGTPSKIVPVPTPTVIAPTPSTPTPVTKTLVIGSTGNDVLSLQTILESQGLLTTYVKGTFDASTEAALKAFQKKYNIISSGTPASTGYGAAGPKTRTKLNSFIPGSKPVAPVIPKKPAVTPIKPATTRGSITPTFIPNPNSPYQRTLTLGARGNDVKQLQIFLNSRGYTLTRSGDGSRFHEYTTFDTNTKNALMKFQTASGLTVTGVLDGETVKVVDKLSGF